MKKKPLILLTGVAVGAGMLLVQDKLASQSSASASSATVASSEHSPSPGDNTSLNEKPAHINQTRQDNEGAPKQPAIAEAISEAVTDDVMTESMTEQFAILSSAYADALSYPSYSQPLNPHDTQWLEPERYSTVSLPVLDGDAQAALSLEKYRFIYPEPITISVSGTLPVEAMTIELLDVETHHILFKQRVNEASLELPGKTDWPQEIRVKATIDFTSGTDVLTADFHYYQPVAEITQVEAPSSAGSDMAIPVQIQVEQSGIYRIRANLFTQSGQPIAVLTEKQRLGEGKQSLTLKAHYSVLNGHNDTLELRTVQVEKMSGFPGEKAQYGISRQAIWPLGTFNTRLLKQAPYQPSAEEQQRLDFLRSAAGQ